VLQFDENIYLLCFTTQKPFQKNSYLTKGPGSIARAWPLVPLLIQLTTYCVTFTLTFFSIPAYLIVSVALPTLKPFNLLSEKLATESSLDFIVQ
jgi:hypothetical protein